MRAISVLLALAAGVGLAQWEPDRRLTYDDSASYASANNAWNVAADGDVVHVVWHDDRVGHSEVFYKRSDDGGATWSPDIRLTTDSAHSFDPCIAVLGSCVHVIRWTSDVAVCYKRSTDQGLTWSEDIFREPSDDNNYPSIAASRENVYAVWGNRRDSYWQVYFRVSYDGGVTWVPVVPLTDTTATGYACVAAWGPDVYVAWTDDRDGNDEIYCKRSADGGMSWSSDIRITNNPTQSTAPCIGASGPDVHMVWSDNQGGLPAVFYCRSTDCGISWSAPAMIGGLPLTFPPSLAACGATVHVVWTDMRDMNLEVYYKRSIDAGATWGPDTRLTVDTAWTWFASVAAAGSRVHVVWQDRRDGNDEIYYKRNPTGNAPGIEEQAATPADRQRSPATVVRGTLRLPAVDAGDEESPVLLDAAGRRVIDLYPGPNDLSRLAPGVYFCRLRAGDGNRTVKLVVQR
jgi:hypothetical protein